MTDTSVATPSELAGIARQIRIDVLDMIYRAGSGHLGGSLSCAEILATLYFRQMRLAPSPPAPLPLHGRGGFAFSPLPYLGEGPGVRACWPGRDRFLLSKGHAAPALYSVLSLKGYMPRDELLSLRQVNSRLQGHPDCKKCPGVDIGAGPLGHGVSVGVGMALAGPLDRLDFRVYTLLGDGELQAGVVWEGAMAAAKFGLDHLVAIVDRDRVQLDGFVADIMPIEPLADKWRSFGWHVLEANGHDVGSLITAFEAAAQVQGRPVCIIAHTVKGKGISFMENKSAWHGRVPTKEEYAQARKELEG